MLGSVVGNNAVRHPPLWRAPCVGGIGGASVVNTNEQWRMLTWRTERNGPTYGTAPNVVRHLSFWNDSECFRFEVVNTSKAVKVCLANP